MSVVGQDIADEIKLLKGLPRAVKSLGIRNVVEALILTRARPFWAMVEVFRPVRMRFNSFLINRAVCKIPTRPNALSTLNTYTSWESLTDRTFSARHLPPSTDTTTQPPAEEVAKLFLRPAGGMQPGKSSVLFTYFAQWFTDGFLRTDYSNPLKNRSTHDIDLSNLYGDTPAITSTLRSFQDGKLASQEINGEEYPLSFYDADGQVVEKFKHLPMAMLTAMLPRMAGGPESAPRPGTTPVDAAHPGSRPAMASSRAALFSGFRDVLARNPIDKMMFAMGGDRINSNVGFTAMNVLFLREHNRICDLLKEDRKCFKPANNSDDERKAYDERLFQTARNILIGVLSRIVIEDYINHITPYAFKFELQPGAFERCVWYRQNWMAIEFNLIYRWHGLTPDRYKIGGRDYSLKETLFNNQLLIDRGLAPLLADASAQRAGRIGLRNTPEELLPVEQGSIELGRKARLMSYNDYRVLCNYPRATSFEQITSDATTQQALKDLYKTVDRVEFYPGIFAESPVAQSVVPLVIGRIVGVDAFSQALTNPLLSKHLYNKHTFTEAGLDVIKQTRTLDDVVKRNAQKSPVSGNLSLAFKPPK